MIAVMRFRSIILVPEVWSKKVRISFTNLWKVMRDLFVVKYCKTATLVRQIQRRRDGGGKAARHSGAYIYLKLSVLSSELGPIYPISRKRVYLPQDQRGGDTLVYGWEGGGPKSDDWRKRLALCTLWSISPRWMCKKWCLSVWQLYYYWRHSKYFTVLLFKRYLLMF